MSPPSPFFLLSASCLCASKAKQIRGKWQHHLEFALLKSKERGWRRLISSGFWLFNSTGATLSAAHRQQLLRCLKMPKQMPMGTKSQVSASLWTVLMMDKAELFIAHSALGMETKKSSYFQLMLPHRGWGRTTSAWEEIQ